MIEQGNPFYDTFFAKDSLASDTIVSTPDTLCVKGFLSPHSLQVHDLKPKLIVSQDGDWVLYWIILVVILFSVGKLLFSKRLNLTFLANFSQRSYSLLLSEGYITRHPLNLMLSGVYVFSLGLFLAMVIHFNGNQIIMPHIDFVFSLKLSMYVLLFILMKYLSMLFVQYIYKEKNAGAHYLNLLLLSYNSMGLFLIMGLWIIIFINTYYGIILTAVLLSVLFLSRQVKNLLVFNHKNNFSLLHFIIYLCTIEILPLILIQKLYFNRFF
jgi:hypothetical protein